ncbi:CBF/NF-Y family transcription factor [Phlyctema vagabunda]|uniref:DNA polymerase epsilon subunit D n=1 Tax=Phlyctema vagabunda TaxID=108571 RepID=A0ABR4PXE3_9HELO
MPPRKSDASKAAAVTGDEGTPAKELREGVNIEDLNLPKSIVTRLAKGVLPPNTQIQGNAMLAMSKSATVFVNNLAAAANANAHAAQRKTINPQDVFQALREDLEFADFVPRLEAELAKFNEISAEKRSNSRKKAAADKGPEKTTTTEDENEETGDRDLNGQPAAKKARRLDSARREESEKEGEDEEVEGDGEGDGEGDEEAEEDEEDDDDDVEEEADQDHDETVEDEEREGEGTDEALDNGEDSD